MSVTVNYFANAGKGTNCRRKLFRHLKLTGFKDLAGLIF